MAVISVVIPAYNAENTILETIQSVQQQTFTDFEIIVINDGSTDKTLELVNTIQEPRLQVFSYENGGLPVARNRGIEQATGEYIAFIDADDLWTPDKLELQLAVLQQHPKAGVAYSWTTFIDKRNKILYAQKPLFFKGNVYADLLVVNFIASGSNILVRKQVIETVGKFNPQLKSAEDWDYNIRLASQYSFVVVPKYQILYRKSSQAMSSKVDVMETFNLFVLEEAFKNAPPELQLLKKKSLANTYQFFSKLHIDYGFNKQSITQAHQRLKKAVELYPKSLFNRETQRLVIKVVLLQLLPWKVAHLLITGITKIFPVIPVQKTIPN